MHGWKLVSDGLRFPEGPVVAPDGSVIVVEIAAGLVTRITPGGAQSTIAKTGGGPNGAAFGPDGYLYVCNNGGCRWREWQGMLLPAGQPHDYVTGSIDRIDVETGSHQVLYTTGDAADGVVPLKGPNDIVFDSHGGFWFTDNGKGSARSKSICGVFYATTDGSSCREVIFPLDGPNGIGLSPDGSTLYVSETPTGRLWAYDLVGPGEVALQAGLRGPSGRCLYGAPGLQLFDSLAVEADGNIAVATIGSCGGITVIDPDGKLVEFVATDDSFTTNICFGGEDNRTAYATLGGSGRLVSRRWPRSGLRLN